MNRNVLLTGVFVAALAAVNCAQVSRADAQTYGGYGNQGMMGPRMMGPGLMGPGRMGAYGCGMGPGMMGWGYTTAPSNLNLSANDIKGYLERWVAMTGNPPIKACPVAEKDGNTVTADIVTTDKGALVQRFDIDRRTGIWQPVR